MSDWTQSPPPKEFIPYFGDKPKRVFRRRPTTTKPWGHQNVSKVYPDAIEIPGSLSAAKGMGVLGMALGFIPIWFGVKFLTHPNSADIDRLLAVLPLVALLYAMGLSAVLVFGRVDLFSYRDHPTLFNRRTRKVHVFRRRINWKRPFSPWPAIIDTYDWDCVRGEVHGGAELHGSVVLYRYYLFITVMKAPNGREVIDRFPVGTPMSRVADHAPYWEHIRAYMDENGPPLQAGEWRNTDHDKFSHRLALGQGLWILHPEFPAWWRAKPVMHTLGFLVCLIASPLLGAMSFSVWLAEVTCRQPKWTPQILADAGGAPISDEELHALIPPPQPDDESKLTEDEREERAYAKTQAAPFWTRERKKYAVTVALILGVMLCARAIQVHLRGY